MARRLSSLQSRNCTSPRARELLENSGGGVRLGWHGTSVAQGGEESLTSDELRAEWQRPVSWQLELEGCGVQCHAGKDISRDHTTPTSHVSNVRSCDYFYLCSNHAAGRLQRPGSSVSASAGDARGEASLIRVWNDSCWIRCLCCVENNGQTDYDSGSEIRRARRSAVCTVTPVMT